MSDSDVQMSERVTAVPKLRERAQSGSRDQVTYLALKELAASQSPVGCWRLRDAVGAAGIEISETTASRVLRDLDRRGLAHAAGVKSGHVITDQGRRELAVLDEARQRDASRDQFLEAIRAETVEDVLDLLVMRRAVEVEAARLAALRGTEEDIARIEGAMSQHEEALGTRGRAWEENSTVHLMIAQASKSRTWCAVLNLILQDRQVIDALVEIERADGSLTPLEHSRILAGIKNRRPEEAAEAMRAHFDRMIQAVERFAVNLMVLPASHVR